MQVIVRYLQASWGWCEWEAGVELKSSLDDLTMIDEKAFFLIDFFYSRIFQTSIESPGDGIALNCICYDVKYTRTTLTIDMFIASTFHVLVSPNIFAIEPSKETQNALANCITLSKWIIVFSYRQSLSFHAPSSFSFSNLPLQQPPEEIKTVTITLQLPLLSSRPVLPTQLFGNE